MAESTEIQGWSIEKSSNLYSLENWGDNYFSINEKGNIAVSPDGLNGDKVDLHELVNSVVDRGIGLPILFRFNGILRHRVRSLYNAFRNAIDENGYKGNYLPAYPIKVNQQRHIVDVLRKAGEQFAMGLEVGSKPELIAVMAIHDDQNALLLCNGYKDREYVELALMSKKVGRRPIITIEKYSELALVLDVAAKLGVEPEIGLRLRLSGRGAGRWAGSGGDRAKFGLTISEILDCVRELERLGKQDCLKLIHHHIGSQLTTISILSSALKEACQLYVQLKKRCPQLTFMDIGGGLGVDYDGSKTNFESSMNYTIDEYARDVVWNIQEICNKAGVPHPDIVTESGRATVAHHSVLVFNVLGIANTFSDPCDPDKIIAETKNSNVENLASLLKEVSPKNAQETLHDAVTIRQDLINQFSLGLLSIEDRAAADNCYWAILCKLAKVSKSLKYIPEDLERLPDALTDTYFCNFSVFQSMPDSWAIDQIFPIMPLHRLNEKPDNNITIGDITCDSDGKIEKFADLRDVKRSLPAHKLKSGEPYYFAAFLVGAYQEILGDLHNLFGDTNAVHIEINEAGKPEITNIVHGDTVRDVLKYVQYEKEDLCERWRNAVENAVTRGAITATESASIYRIYSNTFDTFTYLGSSDD